VSEVPLYTFGCPPRDASVQERKVYYGSKRVQERKVYYRGTSLIRNRPLLGPYSSTCLGPYGAPRGGGVFLWARYPCTDRKKSVLRIGYYESIPPHGGLPEFHVRYINLAENPEEFWGNQFGIYFVEIFLDSIRTSPE